MTLVRPIDLRRSQHVVEGLLRQNAGSSIRSSKLEVDVTVYTILALASYLASTFVTDLWEFLTADLLRYPITRHLLRSPYCSK